MSESVAKLPSWLRKYCVDQKQDQYTSRDHAAWRYIMRQSRAFFSRHAVPVYARGLEKTGITTDRIPLIEDMDRKLRQLGWGAVPVRGFIPPAAFLELQARRILPIAADMRTLEHIHYTPAPDIVHEAAGHAPIIADPAYAEYLTLYAQMAQKAIFSHEDLEQYEAIRALSDIKENPDSTPAMIEQAEAALVTATDNIRYISEAAKVARMYWWTAEYGLLGSLEEPLIYGAGLLSSVGESKNCLDPRVRKIRLSLECVDTAYNITEPQPQLFVAEDLRHLVEVLHAWENSMAFRRGGLYGLNEALRCGSVTTVELDSGLQVSGKLIHFDADDQAVRFLRYDGPVQLCSADREIQAQGVAQHPQGFSSPLGRFAGRDSVPSSTLTDADLESAGVIRGRTSTLKLTSGYVVRGRPVYFHRDQGRLQIIKWQDCTVTRGAETLFRPEWGDFDMIVGERAPSVFGGPADREAYGSYELGNTSTVPGRATPYTDAEKAIFRAYDTTRAARDRITGAVTCTAAETSLELDAAGRMADACHDEWLVRLEAIENAHQALAKSPQAWQENDRLSRLMADLAGDFAHKPTEAWLVREGLALIQTQET